MTSLCWGLSAVLVALLGRVPRAGPGGPLPTPGVRVPLPAGSCCDLAAGWPPVLVVQGTWAGLPCSRSPVLREPAPL